MRARCGSAAVVMGLLVGVAGCSSGGSPATAPSAIGTASPSQSAPPADGGAYTSTDALLAALTAADIPCSAPEAVANATAKGATSMTDCVSPGGTGSDSVVVVFDSQQDAQAYAEGMTDAGLGALAAPAVVYGRNWAVNSTAAYAAQVQAKLGGGVLAGPSPAAS